MKPLERPDMEDDAPEDIREAVRQLRFAYKRSESALTAETAETPAEPEAVSMPETGRTEAPNLRAVDPQEDVFSDALRRAEAILFAAGEPMSALDVAETLPPGVDAATVLMELKAVYANRGVNLIEVAGKWRFQTATDLAFLFVEERHQQKRLGQAALETLAIVAYGQPVTRAEIEAVRGVQVSKGTIDTLMEAGWIKIKGRRQTPGRPVTFGTTDAFLEHFGLESLHVLPGKADLEAEGLLSNVIPGDFQMPGEDGLSEDLPNTDAEDLGDDTQFITDFMDIEPEDAADPGETD